MTDNRKDTINLTAALLSWYDAHRRILPWREDPTPYHVWLSEIMLQQTRVEAVRGYYDRFLKAIPDIPALANADEDIVLKLWEGLGYYSRARNLRRAAMQIMSDYEGKMPDSAAELRKLAGIGEYTAAAIAAIAFGRKEAAVDGNLLRIFARMTEYGENIKAPEAKKAAEGYFLELLDGCLMESMSVKADQEPETQINAGKRINDPFGTFASSGNISGDFNQALMDLGATICLPNAAPKCPDCPWNNFCKAHQNGTELDYPVTPAKKERKTEEKTVLLIRYDGKYLLHQRAKSGLLAGLYEFPLVDGKITEDEALKAAEELGFSALRIRDAGDAKHIFTHKEWHMTGYEIFADELQEHLTEKDSGYVLASPGEIEEKYAMPSALRKYRQYVLKQNTGRTR